MSVLISIVVSATRNNPVTGTFYSLTAGKAVTGHSPVYFIFLLTLFLFSESPPGSPPEDDAAYNKQRIIHKISRIAFA